jgi:nucleoside-diphosphate-sugar epimerase
VRVVVTGGAGFVGRALAEGLHHRGDEVVALVRDPARAQHLVHESGGDGGTIELVRSSLADTGTLRDAMRGADALIHVAGMYRVGISPSERPAMWDANVGTTERVLDAAIAAGVPRIVDISTVNVFGNTKGAVVDETYRRDLAEGFLSVYDETKFRADEAAVARIAQGAPIVIVMPSQVYGPHDHSLASEQLHRAFHGTLRYRAFSSVGTGWVHVHDLAGGILAALDRGVVGERYCLAGPNHTMGESIAIAARVGGKRVPPIELPTALARFAAPLNDAVGGLPGMPASLRETIAASDGVTYWASHAKATRELGFEPRSLDQGIADTWGSH